MNFLTIFFVYNANQIQNYCFFVLPLKLTVNSAFLEYM
jgi:hypothetical protein